MAEKNQHETTINSDRMPRHIAIIMDGNGRWAKKRLLPRKLGHRAGMASLKNIVQACDDLNIPFLTVFAFSTENWKRPVTEVDYLMRLMVEFLHKELMALHRNKIQIKILGDYTAIPLECQMEIREAMELTRNNSGMVFNIGINYGSRQEIIAAVKKINIGLMQGEINLEDIDEGLFSRSLFTGGIPDPDLLIRTAGEMRLSNFMLWQIAYAEIIICETLWPDFTRENLLQAIKEYQGRERRFGGLSQEQAD